MTAKRVVDLAERRSERLEARIAALEARVAVLEAMMIHRRPPKFLSLVEPGVTGMTQTKPSTPESRADWEEASRELQEQLVSMRRDADEMAAIGTPEAKKEAMKLRCRASYHENSIEDLTEFVERRGQWATGTYVKAKRPKRQRP
jgi:hypothetical protein